MVIHEPSSFGTHLHRSAFELRFLRPHQRVVAAGDVLAVAFMALIAFGATRSGVTLVLFPELAALSDDVLTRPRGRWASQPLRIVLTPALSAVAGLLITRHANYGPVSVLLIVLVTLAIIRLLRSSIAPALSAGLLPMVLGERDWMYPPSICVGLIGLVLLLWVWRRFTVGTGLEKPRPDTPSIEDALEANPAGRLGIFKLLGFVVLLSVASKWTGLRFILFPPLVVIAYEIFGHPELPSWMRRPALFPVACFLTASIGVLARRIVPSSVIAVVITVAISILLLRLFRMHMPPALAVGVLPFVMIAPDVWYPISVAIGTTTLAVLFLIQRRVVRRV